MARKQVLNFKLTDVGGAVGKLKISIENWPQLSEAEVDCLESAICETFEAVWVEQVKP